MALRAVTATDVERLALRLRLGSNWRERLVGETPGVYSAHEALVKEGRFSENAAQSAAASSLSKLPAALEKAREARAKWDAEQVRLTNLAADTARRLTKQREEAAVSRAGGWLRRAAEAPSSPAVIGAACWLRLGRPPKLHPAGCYLHGPVGSGKSTMMDLFCLFGTTDLRVRRQHFHEFFLWVHESLHRLGGPKAEEPHSHVMERVADEAAAGTDILCLDEFAVTNVADAAILAEMLRLLAERYVAVVCTTNRPPEDLYKDGLHREIYLPTLTRHLRESYLVEAVQGSDYRTELFEAETAERQPSRGAESNSETLQASSSGSGLPSAAQRIFFHGGEAQEVLHGLLEDDFETSMSGMQPDEVKISWGRKLAIQQSCAGLAVFHFDQLCRQALGAEDFLHIAVKFHTIFVHSIPRLSLEEHNEARRFTNLVDAVYEHNVRLICHSHVPCDEILADVEALRSASEDDHDAERLGVFERMYDDTPNFQLQIKEVGREKYEELSQRKFEAEKQAAEQRLEARRLAKQSAPDAAEGDSGSGWSTAPAVADLSAPQEGVAGVMVAAVGSLQESGFAARRALSRLREMQTSPYLEACRLRRESLWGPA